MNRLYLDTSIVRKYSNELAKFERENVFTSSLVVFELIAGMNEKEFKLRKNVLNNLLKSKIIIDWDSYKMKMHKAFKIVYDDIEGNAIMRFAEEIIKCETYEEVKNLKIYSSENIFLKLESFEEFDKDIEQVGKDFSAKAAYEWRELEKEDRRNFKEQMSDFLCTYSKWLCELALINLVEEFAGSKRPSEQYFKILREYDNSLEVYFYYNQMFFLITEMNGSECGKNDALDLMHTIYLKKNDTIVSEDKIFNKLVKHIKLINVCCSDFLEFNDSAMQ